MSARPLAPHYTGGCLPDWKLLSMTHHLLLIDPQNDFCDLPADWCLQFGLGPRLAPSLPVAGAHADMQRTAEWLHRHAAQIGKITVTLDSHQRLDIAHPEFWQTAAGQPPAPFTEITAAEVRAGSYRPQLAAHLPRALAYLDALEAQGRYRLMIWPVHCEVGSWGHGIHAHVLAACGQWQVQQQQAVHHVFKGLNPWTEHYSALQAEVVDPLDAATALNQTLLDALLTSSQLIVAGEASSHCVRATLEHLLAHAPADFAPRLVLLIDCMSPVSGFAAEHDAFLARMSAAGALLARSTDYRI